MLFFYINVYFLCDLQNYPEINSIAFQYKEMFIPVKFDGQYYTSFFKE